MEQLFNAIKEIATQNPDGFTLFYYDSVRIFTDLDEAMRFAKENEQIAIFNLARPSLIKL
jgi:hypothetical protein